MTTPTVTVLLPVYNAENTLPCALMSIAKQSFSDYQLLVIDDGSTDKSLTIARQYQRMDSRIEVIAISHQGIVKALNHGLHHSTGSLIARMDADDLSQPQRLQQQTEFLFSFPEYDLVASQVTLGNTVLANEGFARYVGWSNSLLTSEQIALSRFIESPLVHPSVMFRRQLINKWGSYRQGNFPEDYELWLRWLEKGVKMHKLAQPLLQWNDSPKRLSRQDLRYRICAFYQCKSFYLARWLQQHNPFHPHVVIWGAGKKTRQRASYLTQHGIEIQAYIDIAPNRIGQIIHERPVWDYQQLSNPGNCFILSYVANRGAREKIANYLQQQGWRNGQDFLLVA